MNATRALDWALIAPHLDRALELAADARDGWLAQLAGTHPAIAGTVSELLKERAALDARRFMMDPPIVAEDVILEGRRIGAYTIERLLARGGMGEVWLAARSDGRFEGRFAIKFIDRGHAHAKLRERFAREGRVLARLAHPNIARLVDAGATDQGRSYLVLEYIDGERIDAYCNRLRLDVRARVKLFLDVVAAVAHAHANLVVHRDLKPSNVLVTPDGAVKLLDFGIAKLLADEVENSEATRYDETVLTPDYAAPEQFLGQTPSTATDVYQLGILLFVLLTGQLPFAAGSDRAARMRAALQGNLARASEAADRAVARLLRGDLDAIIATALRREPAHRYATVAALRDDLAHHLHDEPVSARRGAWFYRARKFARRHWPSVAAATVALATLVAAVVITRWQLLEVREQRAAALTNARRATATKDFLQLVLSDLQSRSAPLTTEQLLKRSSTLLKAQYSDRPAFVGEMLIEMAAEYGDISDANTSLALLADARAAAQTARDFSLLATAECLSAYIASANDALADAELHLAAGRDALARAPDPNATVRAECMNARSQLEAVRGNRPNAIRIQQATRAMLESAGEQGSRIYGDVLAGLGIYLHDDGQTGDAIAAFRLELDNDARYGRTGTRLAFIDEQNLAAALYGGGEVREAYALHRHSWERLKALDRVDDMNSALVINLIGSMNRLKRADFDEQVLADAMARFEQRDLTRNLMAASVDLARMRFNAGASSADVQEPLDRFDAAAGRGLKRSISLNTLIPMEVLRAEVELRDGAAQLADQRAERLLKKISEAPKEVLPQSHFVALKAAARTALAVGDATRALRYARDGLRIAEPLARGADTSADVGEILLLTARAQLAQGRSGDARVQLTRAVRCLRNGYGDDHPATREAAKLLAAHGERS